MDDNPLLRPMDPDECPHPTDWQVVVGHSHVAPVEKYRKPNGGTMVLADPLASQEVAIVLCTMCQWHRNVVPGEG